MPLGKEVGLGSGDFMFDGYAAPPEKKAQPHPIFGPCLLWPNGWNAGWIKVPLGTEANLGPGDVVFDGVAGPPKRASPPVFGCMSIVAKRVDG